MPNQLVGEGAFQRAGSNHWSNNSEASTIDKVVIAVIQKTMVSVGTFNVVRRSLCVPSAQNAAAVRASNTPRGRPERAVNSCHNNSTTPSAAAATPPQARPESLLPNTSAPNIAEKIGMV